MLFGPAVATRPHLAELTKGKLMVQIENITGDMMLPEVLELYPATRDKKPGKTLLLRGGRMVNAPA